MTAVVESGADVHAKDIQGYGRPLHHGGGCCFLFGRCDAGTCWPCRGTALHLASGQGHTEIVKTLVKVGADVHCKNDEGYIRAPL